MNYIKQIFDMLSVKPEEEFKIKGKNNALPYLYKFTEKLETYSYDADEEKWRRLYTSEILKDVLNGTYKIVKIPQPTAEEQLAIDYARACGYKWLAKDKDDEVRAFKRKPVKIYSNGYWYVKELIDNVSMVLHIPISFIHWEDEEPYEIEQKETEGKEMKKVCEHYSEGKCMARIYHPNVVCEGNKNRCYAG